MPRGLLLTVCVTGNHEGRCMLGCSFLLKVGHWGRLSGRRRDIWDSRTLFVVKSMWGCPGVFCPLVYTQLDQARSQPCALEWKLWYEFSWKETGPRASKGNLGSRHSPRPFHTVTLVSCTVGTDRASAAFQTQRSTLVENTMEREKEQVQTLTLRYIFTNNGKGA